MLGLDLTIVALCWIASFYIRFQLPIVPVYKEVPPIGSYLLLLLFIIPIWGAVFKFFGLYRSKRAAPRLSEFFVVARAVMLAMLMLIAVTFVLRQYSYSRLVFAYFGMLSIIAVTATRTSFREFLRQMRKRGYNLRYILVVGAGKLGQEVLRKINARPEIGFRVVGILGKGAEKVGSRIDGVAVLGVYEDAKETVQKLRIDQVIIAMPLEAHRRMEAVLRGLIDEMVDIRVVPDLYQFTTLRGSIEEFNGLPFITLQETPLYGWNRVLKRLADIVFSASAIFLISPLLILISVAVKISSSGPVFYRQERMGLDGRTFSMLKFRSMKADAEKETGAVWAKQNDERCTKIGNFLRRTSLDELPQFFNVLKGEMSVVGPRPERPVFVEKFKRSIPHYMLRHKMKSGMTGWAQINGYKGNTSLKKRIELDLHYIERWSLLLDLYIVLLTTYRWLFPKVVKSA